MTSSSTPALHSRRLCSGTLRDLRAPQLTAATVSRSRRENGRVQSLTLCGRPASPTPVNSFGCRFPSRLKSTKDGSGATGVLRWISEVWATSPSLQPSAGLQATRRGGRRPTVEDRSVEARGSSVSTFRATRRHCVRHAPPTADRRRTSRMSRVPNSAPQDMAQDSMQRDGMAVFGQPQRV